MDSEGSDQAIVEDSDESLLDIREINDIEFDIPHVTPPSLESVLWDMESEEGSSDTASLHSFQSITARFRSMLCHKVLQGISNQIASAGERVGAGLPTVITNSLKYVAVGTSHGYVLLFDSEQNLCWCCYDTNSSDQGAISALAFNLDSTRLLIGYERGFISMVDATNGDIIRRLPDAHAPQTATLHLRFTFLNNLALCGDSSGCVFSLQFNRRLGVRSWDSKCLFSGARGEVCIFEPLIQGYDINFLTKHVLVAMATLSKVIVITIKPRLKVLFSQQLPKVSTTLPLISWQLVSVGRTFQPVLAWGRSNELNYTRVVQHNINNNRIRLLPLRNVQLPYTLTALHWLGSKHLAVLDTSENLHLIEVRQQRELELLELANAGLVYGSAHFKALACGGGVSEAFALAGERACYNSLSSRGDQLLILGTKVVHLIKLRTWPERLTYLCEQGRWTEALNLAADEENASKDIFATTLLKKYFEYLNTNLIDKDSLTAAVNCCVKLQKIDILCNELLEAVSNDQSNQDWYFQLLTDHITNGILTNLNPSVTQMLVDYLETKDPTLLEAILLKLNVECLDLHQVLSICKKRKLYNSWIYITTKTIGDYASPLPEFLSELTPDNHRLGNTLLVYVSCCLAGLQYPNGNIPDKDKQRVKHDILRCLETVHSINSNNESTYPYLRALLKYNTRECLNVIKLAFTEEEFSGEMGLLQRQRLVRILLEIVKQPEFNQSQILNLACFITRLITSNNLNIEDDLIMFDEIFTILSRRTTIKLSLRDHSEREQAWLDLLLTKKLTHLTIDDLLKRALDAECYRIVEYLYELKKDYSNILICYLKDPIRHNDVFNYILNYINDNERYIKQQFLVNFKDLIKINSKKTSEIIVEHFPDLIEQFNEILLDNQQLQYEFLNGIVSYDQIKLPTKLSEQYLELLCQNNPNQVYNYLQTTNSSCRIDEALKITKKYQQHKATALLLEKNGEWLEALELLLNNNMIDDCINLCIRGVDHLDTEHAQQLWLILLKNKKSTRTKSIRQLLHSAAPHVPPAQLLNLVSNANFGDIKNLLQGILYDHTHDIQMLTVTIRMLSKELHHGLAKSLQTNGKAVSVTNINCRICQKPLTRRDIDENIAIWGCGHCFHSECLRATESDSICPQCRNRATLIKSNNKPIKNRTESKLALRPDLEGSF